MTTVRSLAEKAQAVKVHLGLLSVDAKNIILEKIAERLEENSGAIEKANLKDISTGKRNKLTTGPLDRLLLNKGRLKNVVAEVRKVAALKYHAGEILESRELPNGLFLKRVRVPIGVVGMVYEARPNVTVDAAMLCFKSGNAVILRGGSDALHTNRVLVRLIRDALKEFRLQDAVQMIDIADRRAVNELVSLRGLVDVIIPRGGAELINFVRENSTVPIIETGASVVHTYVHGDADIGKAVQIVMNAKLRRVSICNTLDTLLLNRGIAHEFLRAFVSALPKNSYKADHLEIRADKALFDILRTISKPKDFFLSVKKAGANDFDTEFLDYILAVKEVRTLDEALEHISHHSLKHSEAIITEDRKTAERFLQMVDSACVYWNASTQFSDGAQFGLGAEIGISTQKLHVRGPFALEGLTSYKWVIEGNGQVRKP